MPDQVPGPVKKTRTAEMIALGEQLGAAYHARYDRATRPVLWEMATGAERDGLRWVGYTDNYIRVTAVGPADLMNRVTPARLSGPRADGMMGEIDPAGASNSDGGKDEQHEQQKGIVARTARTTVENAASPF